MNGKCILCCFDKKMMDELGATRKDLDGISAQLLLTEGVDCSVFLHEIRTRHLAGQHEVCPDHGCIQQAASLSEGGGHIRAAGCTIRIGDRSGDQESHIEDEIEGQLRNAGVI